MLFLLQVILYFNYSNMIEIIKGIKGFEDRYTISNLGNVRSLMTGRVLKPNVTKFGYARVNLRAQNGKYKSFFIHRLVALNFLPNPDHYSEINHKDCNRLNNIVTNLEWCTRSYNIKYSYEHGNASRKGLKNPNAKLSLEDIEAIRALARTRRFYNYEIAKLFGISKSNADYIINGTTWSDNKTNRDNQQPRFDENQIRLND